MVQKLLTLMRSLPLRRSLTFDALALAGGCVFGVGLWLIYPPLAWLFAGVVLLIIGIWGAWTCS